jgi:glycolate oxidase
MDDIVVNEFSVALGRPDAVVDDIATLTAAGHDYWGVGGIPGLVVRPITAAEVVDVLRIAAERKIPVVTRGGGSNCAGAMMPSRDEA